MNTKTIILAGGSGFIGRALAKTLIERGYRVLILTRQATVTQGNPQYLHWDGVEQGDWSQHLDGAYGIVNLTGKNVDCRYHEKNRTEILESRIHSVQALAKAVNAAQIKPKVWVQVATTAILGDAGEQLCDETTPTGKGFSPDVARAWEKAFDEAALPDTRKVILRVSFVLGRDGGALQRLKQLTRFFLGGAVGTGEQFYSWIHIDDLCEMFVWSLEHPDITGLYNATAPYPERNDTFMRLLRKTMRRPWSPRTPAFLVRIGCFFMRTEHELALRGRRCIPKRFSEVGFPFRFEKLQEAFNDLIKTQ